MDDMLIKFKEVVDEEIHAYESLGDLYEKKQSILIQGKSDALWDIDDQIIQKADAIKAINQKRKEVARYLGSEDLTISEIIEKAKNANDAIADNLENQKTRLRILAKSISLQEKTNNTLIKHGLIMVDKTLDVLVGVLAPQMQNGQYNSHGQTIKSDKSMISSISEQV